MPYFSKPLVLTLAVICCLLLPDRAEAFRCGSKLVAEGMHEQQVLGACGEPTTRRHLGYALRGYRLPARGGLGGWTIGRDRTPGTLVEEVAITEFVYNFGPRKLMRRLRFEGGVLVRIESIGYGYREK